MQLAAYGHYTNLRLFYHENIVFEGRFIVHGALNANKAV